MLCKYFVFTGKLCSICKDLASHFTCLLPVSIMWGWYRYNTIVQSFFALVLYDTVMGRDDVSKHTGGRLLSMGVVMSTCRRSHDMICKRCSFECDMGKYSTRPMNEVWAFRRTPYSLDMCCIFTHLTKINNVCIFLHDQVTHNILLPYIVLNLQLECDTGWYPYTSHSKNQSTECDIVTYFCFH